MEHVDPFMGIIVPYVNTAIFLGLAWFFFNKPARAAAAKRKVEFEKLMTEARAARDAALAKLEELKRRDAGMAKEIADMYAVSQASAQQEAAKIVADAERLAEHFKAEAQRIAAAEVDKARQSLRAEIIETVRQGVAQKLRAELGDEAQLGIVHARISDLNKIKNNSTNRN